MADKIFQLGTRPGIKRDGTEFDSEEYTNGVWCRFDRGRPRKVRGYRQLTDQMTYVSRGLFLNAAGGTNYIVSGNELGIELVTQNQRSGTTATPVSYNLPAANFAADPTNLWSFDAVVDVSGDNRPLVLLAHPGQNLQAIDNNDNTAVLYGDITNTMNEFRPLQDYRYSERLTFIMGSANPIPASGSARILYSFQLAGNPFNVNENNPATKVSVSMQPGGVDFPPNDNVQNGIATHNSTTNITTFVGGVAFSEPGMITSVTSTTVFVISGNPFNLTVGAGPVAANYLRAAGEAVTPAVYIPDVNGTTGSSQVRGNAVFDGTNTTLTTNTAQATWAIGNVLWQTTLLTNLTMTPTNGPPNPAPTDVVRIYGTWPGGAFAINVGDTVFVRTRDAMGLYEIWRFFAQVIEVTGDGMNGQTSYIRFDTPAAAPVSGFPIDWSTTEVIIGLLPEAQPVDPVQLTPWDSSWGVFVQTIETLEVSGGVVQLHPFTFIYGNNGLIKNNDVSTTRVPLQTWTGGLANEVNAAATKIVAALPIRGGSNSPSGLFWSLNSLIRVSFSGGVSATTGVFRYDTVSADTSILSSKSIAEIDGVYYWIGTDRFYVYNGVVQELPNEKNLNYFFDNINLQQRQKVFALVVKRWGEIWWFWPNGGSNQTECNDVIVYNYRSKLWYDMGKAVGCQRSAGVTSQIFPFPILADNIMASNVNPTQWTNGSVIANNVGNNILTLQAQSGSLPAIEVGSFCSALQTGPFVRVEAINGNLVTVDDSGQWGNSGTPGGRPELSTFFFTTPAALIHTGLWQHETGVNQVAGNTVQPILSSIETSDLSWSGGGVSQRSLVTDEFSMRLSRIEPDFNGNGSMTLTVVGRKYPQSTPETVSRNYDFTTAGGSVSIPLTEKIDLREQRRLIRLNFTSNVIDGDFEMGRVLIHAEQGDNRPSGG